MPLTPLQALNKVVENTVVDLRLTSARTIANLYNKGRVKSVRSTQINWDVVVGGAAVAIEPLTQDGADTATDNTVPANLTIGTHRVKYQFPISRVAIQEARERAPSDLVDLFGTTIRGGVIQLMRQMNQLIWNGSGTATSGNVIGLQKVLDNTYNYAGIDPVVYPDWKVPTLGNAGTARPLSKAIMNKFDKLVLNQETYYDYITCNPNVGESYANLWDSLAGGASLTTDPGGTPSTVGNGAMKRIDLGHGYRNYNGMPIVEDPLSPDNQLVFMNTDDIDLITFDMGVDPNASGNVASSDHDYSQVLSSKVNGMDVHIAQLPSNNSAVLRFEMFTVPQLRVRNRKSLMVIKDITSDAT